MPKKNVPRTMPYTLRLKPDDKKWLDEQAIMHSTSAPAILVHAIDALRQYVNAHGGKLITPINIRELWKIVESQNPDWSSSNIGIEGPADHPAKPKTIRK